MKPNSILHWNNQPSYLKPCLVIVIVQIFQYQCSWYITGLFVFLANPSPQLSVLFILPLEVRGVDKTAFPGFTGYKTHKSLAVGRGLYLG